MTPGPPGPPRGAYLSGIDTPDDRRRRSRLGAAGVFVLAAILAYALAVAVAAAGLYWGTMASTRWWGFAW